MKTRVFETYSFWWSEARLLIAAIALFLGGVPPLYLLVSPSLYTTTTLILKVSWIISGVAAGHLLYRWYDTGQKLFGHKDHKDTLAFLLLIVTGLNLGFAGVFGLNLGMNISRSPIVFFIVAALYLFAAYQLWTSYQKNKRKIF